MVFPLAIAVDPSKVASSVLRRLITCSLLLVVVETSAELISTNEWSKEDLPANRETNAHHFQRYVSKRQSSIADGSSTNLRIMTFNARNYSAVGERDVPLAKVTNSFGTVHGFPKC